MLKGAVKELHLGDPWELRTDSGPVIDEAARKSIADHIATAQSEGRVLFQLPTPQTGTFIAPTMIKVDGIADMTKEIFGPVLHVATFKSNELDDVIDAINATGYGLTFGLQTRIDDRVQHVSDRIHAGNIYINRNQIGAIVGSQPFGGEGLSGTGPKAGGPLYLSRFLNVDAISRGGAWETEMTASTLQAAIDACAEGAAPETQSLPGPTGESNRLTTSARLPVLCLGPTLAVAEEQADAIRSLGGRAVAATGAVSNNTLQTVSGISGVIWWGPADQADAD